ncbi:hypothetical protein [Actinocatenispora thailandica]|uniref:hypothetical protein n=1 Tax=Actinocatenispora thailandica TaxID=227318 RepID=UPI001950885E|nr:hypothetical protein [Actinocatenispora thailandica]
MPAASVGIAVGIAVVCLAGWLLLAVRGRPAASAPIRLVATVALLLAGGTAGYALRYGPQPLPMVAGAVLGYLVAHTAGWLFDLIRRRGLRGTGLARNAPAAAREYRLRTVLLPGASVAGLAAGLGAAGGLLGLLVLVAFVVLRREFLGAPLVALVAAVVVVLVPAGMLRARWMRDVTLRLSDDEVQLHFLDVDGRWRVRRAPLAEIRSVTVFADPYGRARWLRVDAGDTRFELRCAPGLAGRGAAETLRRASRDLLGRPGWRPASGVRPYRARWGARRYRGPARDNR